MQILTDTLETHHFEWNVLIEYWPWLISNLLSTTSWPEREISQLLLVHLPAPTVACHEKSCLCNLQETILMKLPQPAHDKLFTFDAVSGATNDGRNLEYIESYTNRIGRGPSVTEKAHACRSHWCSEAYLQYWYVEHSSRADWDTHLKLKSILFLHFRVT